MGLERINRYSKNAFNHYLVGGEHMKGLKGYESYAKTAETEKKTGVTQDDSGQ